MTIQETENKIIREFEDHRNWEDKYTHIMNYGNHLPLIDPSLKTDQYLISGCQSHVWIESYLNDGKVMFRADSDAIISRGIVSILVQIFSDHTPDEIINADLTFIEKLELEEHLSPTRVMGMRSIVKQMKFYALAFKSKLEL